MFVVYFVSSFNLALIFKPFPLCGILSSLAICATYRDVVSNSRATFWYVVSDFFFNFSAIVSIF